jgi:hypothetical protein
MGLDNRNLLPPFAPTGRSQDMLFSRLLWSCEPSALFATYPAAIVHRWNTVRRFEPEARWRGVGSLNLNTLLCLLLDPHQRRLFTEPGAVRSCADNLAVVGQLLMSLGELGFNDAVDHWRQLSSASAAHLADWLDRLLEWYPGSPAYWIRDIERQQQSARSGARSARAGWPADGPRSMTASSYRAHVAVPLSRLGAALQCWQALHRAACQIGVDEMPAERIAR